MLTRYYQKKQKRFQRKARSIKIFLKKKKTKGINMLLNDIEIFLKKKKKLSI